MFNDIYRHKKVFLTGHTGFKGSWLAFWLKKLGADVFGYSLEPPAELNHINFLDLDMPGITADVRNADILKGALKDFQPEIVFHLAAQSLVRKSYDDPVETFETNVMGSVFLFEACRQSDSVRAIVNITSDKCYENREKPEGYRESDPVGGHDPYSCSKGCAELVTACYRRSFFSSKKSEAGCEKVLASCRAGNVIGGGDWARDRLIPDVIRAVAEKKPALIRHPKAVRPWQHVLEPLSGYLLLGQRLLEGRKEFSQAWNFGPEPGGAQPVEHVVRQMAVLWDRITYAVDDGRHPHETMHLQLNCDKARRLMKWQEVWSIEKALTRTVNWYRAFYDEGRILTDEDFSEYINDAVHKGLVWAV